MNLLPDYIAPETIFKVVILFLFRFVRKWKEDQHFYYIFVLYVPELLWIHRLLCIIHQYQ